MSDNINEFLDRVRKYYHDFNQPYLETVGPTIQAGVYIRDGGNISGSNVYLAKRAGVEPGHRVLDAGCGVAGPAIDVARAFEGTVIDGVTISPTQVETAHQRVKEAGLSDRVNIHLGDYHELPFDDGTFDVVYFFECTTYSYDIEKLYAGVYRVLKPGGRFYIKDVFLKEGPLTEEEEAEIKDFDTMFSLYRTYPMSEGRAAAEKAGFVDIETSPLQELLSTDHFIKAMFTFDYAGQQQLTSFGQHHFRQYKCLPTSYGELRARKPE